MYARLSTTPIPTPPKVKRHGESIEPIGSGCVLCRAVESYVYVVWVRNVQVRLAIRACPLPDIISVSEVNRILGRAKACKDRVFSGRDVEHDRLFFHGNYVTSLADAKSP